MTNPLDKPPEKPTPQPKPRKSKTASYTAVTAGELSRAEPRLNKPPRRKLSPRVIAEGAADITRRAAHSIRKRFRHNRKTVTAERISPCRPAILWNGT